MSFSEDVKTARTQLKLSQMAFAKELNICFSSLNRWENGKTTPHPLVKEVFYSYCKRKGVKFEERK
ncbi:MAG: helix-turn-helix transcriptional regulator [Clostridia bacterium]|uniref:helix-turn-helix domain-containing protein n=1 Tax=Chryseobacterium sp. TaxID=1871047 RepID=UPI003053F8C0